MTRVTFRIGSTLGSRTDPARSHSFFAFFWNFSCQGNIHTASATDTIQKLVEKNGLDGKQRSQPSSSSTNVAQVLKMPFSRWKEGLTLAPHEIYVPRNRVINCGDGMTPTQVWSTTSPSLAFPHQTRATEASHVTWCGGGSSSGSDFFPSIFSSWNNLPTTTPPPSIFLVAKHITGMTGRLARCKRAQLQVDCPGKSQVKNPSQRQAGWLSNEHWWDLVGNLKDKRPEQRQPGRAHCQAKMLGVKI